MFTFSETLLLPLAYTVSFYLCITFFAMTNGYDYAMFVFLFLFCFYLILILPLI